jgi:hypothetical protein
MRWTSLFGRKSDDELNADPSGAAELASRAGRCPLKPWQRYGVVGVFAFFLIKGLLWLLVPAIILFWRSLAG